MAAKIAEPAAMVKPIPTYSFTSSPCLSVFTLSPAEFLKSKSTPSDTAATQVQPYTLLATGALILTTHPCQSKVLLLQRAPTDSMPLRWEIPGGAVDDTDTTILHACARELFEEAGLTAGMIEDVVRSDGRVFPISRGRFVCKLEFLVSVEVEGGDSTEVPVVKLDPNEHCAFVWATEEEVRSGEISGGQKLDFTDEEQRKVVLEAFEVCRRKKQSECR
jgi:8-oxo-dGTP pyrophosphatase MutT (NUDIX family)